MDGLEMFEMPFIRLRTHENVISSISFVFTFNSSRFFFTPNLKCAIQGERGGGLFEANSQFLRKENKVESDECKISFQRHFILYSR